MTLGWDDGAVVSALGVSEVTSLGDAAIVRVAHCTDARCVSSLRTVVEPVLSRRPVVLVVDVHDLRELDGATTRTLSDLTRRALEQGTAVRVIGAPPAAVRDGAGVQGLAKPA
jgi:hypothetical protein